VGWSLGWLGRLPEAFDAIARARSLCEEDGTPEMVGYITAFEGEARFRALDPDAALRCARAVEEINERLGTPSLSVYAPLTFAFAHLAAGRAADAIEAAEDALERMGQVEKFQAGVAAELLAEAWLEAGDPENAKAAAENAIELSRRSDRANYEAAAHGVLARALLRIDGAGARKAAEAELAEAAALIERTGARLLSPSLMEWRAELAAVLGDDTARDALLREAQQGYQAVGAPNHAARIAGVLGS
jgi:ATP/maltotriose-dependent transcriptional regulator MalT